MAVGLKKFNLFAQWKRWFPWLIGAAMMIGLSTTGWYGYQEQQQKLKLGHDLQASWQEINDLTSTSASLEEVKMNLENQLASVSAEYAALAAVDQKLRNDELTATISAIEKTYAQAVETYEDLLKLKEQNTKITGLDEQFTKVLVYLKEHNYASGAAQLQSLAKSIKTEQDKLAASAAAAIPANVPESNQAPASGYSRQKVTTPVGGFMISMTAADLGNTKVIVDTASAGDCRDNCPVLPLGEYVARNGAFAGVNGAYFCPATYPSCAGKTNSFDTLLMNKNKTYFNSDNNVYSTVPAVIFGSGWIRFAGTSQEWGRDTGIDSMIANHPLLVTGGNVAFGGDSDPKKGSRAGRSFVAHRGNTVYIGVVHGATVVEAAHALKVLGMDNALNLDSGGSTAYWHGGYKVGPGRNIPNAILLVRK